MTWPVALTEQGTILRYVTVVADTQDEAAYAFQWFLYYLTGGIVDIPERAAD